MLGYNVKTQLVRIQLSYRLSVSSVRKRNITKNLWYAKQTQYLSKQLSYRPSVSSAIYSQDEYILQNETLKLVIIIGTHEY